MIVKEAKEIVAGMELSEAAKGKIEELLLGLSDEADLPDALLDRILAIVDLEIDANEIAKDVYQTGVDMADDFLEKISQESEKAAEEINKVTDNKNP